MKEGKVGVSEKVRYASCGKLLCDSHALAARNSSLMGSTPMMCTIGFAGGAPNIGPPLVAASRAKNGRGSGAPK